MKLLISTTTWYPGDDGRLDAFEERVRGVASGHEVVIVPPGGDLLTPIADADAFFPLSGHSFTREVVRAGRKLKWVHLASAGVEHALYPELLESDITVTNSAGVYAIPIAEHVLGLMLALSRRLPDLMARQKDHVWKGTRGGELYEKTVLIVGLGGIGRRVASLCRGVGMRVLGVRRRPENPDPDAQQVYAPDDLSRILPEADWVVLCAALTPNTKHLLGPAEIACMKPSARVINIARGRLIDERALIEALRESRLAGAGLDVFEEEPLPADSPLWDMPNVIITPHTSGSSPRSMERTLELFADNLARFVEGSPLINVVDKAEGY